VGSAVAWVAATVGALGAASRPTRPMAASATGKEPHGVLVDRLLVTGGQFTRAAAQQRPLDSAERMTLWLYLASTADPHTAAARKQRHEDPNCPGSVGHRRKAVRAWKATLKEAADVLPGPNETLPCRILGEHLAGKEGTRAGATRLSANHSTSHLARAISHRAPATTT